VWCVILSSLFYKFTQATLEWSVGRNGASFLIAVWYEEAFHRLGVQDVTEFIPTDALTYACWEKK
jgi:hypothetical protein